MNTALADSPSHDPVMQLVTFRLQRSRYIQGVATQEDNLLILIDLKKLLTEEEWNEVGML